MWGWISWSETSRWRGSLFGCSPGLSYQNGNAMHLDFADNSFDRVHCLEAAFHFPDRATVSAGSVSRVEAGGTKMVVVDFAWNTAADRATLNDPETRMIRDIWQWDDMYDVAEYTAVARSQVFAKSARWTGRIASPNRFRRHFNGCWRLAAGPGCDSGCCGSTRCCMR